VLNRRADPERPRSLALDATLQALWCLLEYDLRGVARDVDERRAEARQIVDQIHQAAHVAATQRRNDFETDQRLGRTLQMLDDLHAARVSRREKKKPALHAIGERVSPAGRFVATSRWPHSRSSRKRVGTLGVRPRLPSRASKRRASPNARRTLPDQRRIVKA